MNFLELVKRNRSYRRFFQDEKITKKTLEELVELARFSASGGNMQPLRFVLSFSQERNDKIFSCLKWAMMLKGWNGPEEGERPAAYIVILKLINVSAPNNLDPGIMAQSMLLGAVDKGFGGCMFGAVNKPLLTEYLGLDSAEYEIALVIALGKPKEKIIVDDIPAGADTKYYREGEIHHVPKILLKDLIVG